MEEEREAEDKEGGRRTKARTMSMVEEDINGLF